MNKDPGLAGGIAGAEEAPTACHAVLLLLHHGQEPLLVGMAVHVIHPLGGRGGGQRLDGLVLLAVRHDLLEGRDPRGQVLVGDHVVAVLVARASDFLDRDAVGQAELGLRKTARVGGDDGNAAELGLGDNDAPSLVPERGSEEDLDAVPDLVRVLGCRLDPEGRKLLAFSKVSW